MAESKRARFLPQQCPHHSQKAHQDDLLQPHSYNINDVAITLSESVLGPVQWNTCEKSLKNSVARVLSDQGTETDPKIVSPGTIFSLMKAIDELCLLGVLFPTSQINHVSHPVLLEVGQARGRVGWTQPLRGNKSSGGPSIAIRLSTVRYHLDGTRTQLPLRELVQIAVHEMVHAYLILFSCRREQCEVDFDVMHRNADGGGHGLAFVALLKAVVCQIQSWAPGLGDFGLTDEAIHPYEDFGLELWKRGDRISSRSKGQRVWWLAARPM